ncbi:MAG: hypothetical protein ACKV2Q_16385 [Planctomycetaceae bacterium]
MTTEAAVANVIDALEELQIPYLLVGAFASNTYCVPRATNDADFVVTLEPGRLNSLADRLGASFRLNRQVLLETITLTTRHELVHLPTRFLIELFRQSEDPHHVEQFRRRRRQFITALQRDVWLPTAEDVVVQKLRWQRSKDLDDVKAVIAVSGETLEWDYISHWAIQHGTWELLQQVRAALPNLDGLDID